MYDGWTAYDSVGVLARISSRDCGKSSSDRCRCNVLKSHLPSFVATQLTTGVFPPPATRPDTGSVPTWAVPGLLVAHTRIIAAADRRLGRGVSDGGATISSRATCTVLE